MVLPYPGGAVYLPLLINQPVTVHLTFIRIAVAGRLVDLVDLPVLLYARFGRSTLLTGSE
jgi:hypothetical protein